MLAENDGHLDLDCGIAYDRIASWLEDDLALPRSDGRWMFHRNGGTCSIALEPLESRAFRNVCIERTRLMAEGEPDALESFERLFTLRFISAGG
ncbi:MAG TPA: hypothetical protein DCP91_01475 [Eggerthellaceae bacterium]|nr:hypothetical protein [Eggerthellaceae bacterium]